MDNQNQELQFLPIKKSDKIDIAWVTHFTTLIQFSLHLLGSSFILILTIYQYQSNLCSAYVFFFKSNILYLK